MWTIFFLVDASFAVVFSDQTRLESVKLDQPIERCLWLDRSTLK